MIQKTITVNNFHVQIKRYKRAEENYNKIAKKKDVTLDEEIAAIIAVLEEVVINVKLSWKW